MNWKLILQLSMFGLAMGLATVFFIPSKIEPFLWLLVFLASAYAIARRCASKHFLHGLFVGIVNSFWVTAAHVVFFNQYMAQHPQEAETMQSFPFEAPKLMVTLTGPVVGAMSGLVIGVLALIASKVLRPRPGSANSSR